MITTVHFQGVRSLLDVTVDLERFTFLVGPNGCGKSTLLDQVELLCRLSQTSPRGVSVATACFNAMQEVEPTRGTAPLKQQRWLAQDQQKHLLSLSKPEPSQTQTSDKGIFTLSGPGFHQGLDFAARKPGDDEAAAKILAEEFDWRAQRLRLSAGQLRQRAPTSRTKMSTDGFGLPSLLAQLAMNDQDAYAAVRRDLRAIVPQFDSIRIETMNDGPQPEYQLSLVMRGTGAFPAYQVSDGTLFALALLTVVHSPDLATVVLIDDIDQGLHLRAQIALVDAIRAVMELRPELQVICTTHSPYLLDRARPEEVRVMSLDANGHTQVRRLTDHPQYAKLHLGLQTGEFWASMGEEWVSEAARE